MKSIAIFYASEGTGHKTAAENLRDEFLRENPEGSVLCRDVLEYIPSFLHHTVSDGYLQMARRAPWLWGLFYWGSDKPGLEASAFDRCHNLLCRLYLPALQRTRRRLAPKPSSSPTTLARPTSRSGTAKKHPHST